MGRLSRKHRAYVLALGIFWSWIVAGVLFSSVVWPGSLPAGDQPPTVSFQRSLTHNAEQGTP